MTNINKKISDIILNFLDVKEEVQYEKLLYFLKNLLGELEKIVVIILLFGFMGMIKEIILELTIIIFIRAFLGGNHRDTFAQCLMQSVIVCILPYIFINIGWNFMIKWIVNFTLGIWFLFFAPVRSPKRLEYHGKILKRMRRRGIIVLIIINLLAHFSTLYWQKIVYYTLLVLSSDAILAGKKYGFSKYKT